MDASFFDTLISTLFVYWEPKEIAVNINAICNIFGALFLGLFVGYERSYHGRAAGMRTYGLVCMASCAIISIGAQPEAWFGGSGVGTYNYIDPTRVIQGITTGIGFLCAGVIMRDGLNISGLTTAASIWVVSGIGILVGIGYYFAAIVVSVMSAVLMMWGAKIEDYLPTRHAVSIKLVFHKDVDLTESDISQLLHAQGFKLADGSFMINRSGGQLEWSFVAISQGKRKRATLVKLSDCLKRTHGIEDFKVAHARN